MAADVAEFACRADNFLDHRVSIVERDQPSNGLCSHG